MNEPRKQLELLGLTESEITVYLAMVSGSMNARDIIKATGLKRPTVYYAIGCLEKRGLVGKTGKEGDGKIFLEPLEKLEKLSEEKLRESAALHESMSHLVPFLQSQQTKSDEKPMVAFYEGLEAVQQIIMEMLYCKNKQIESIVPKENFFWQVGRDFVSKFVNERTRRGIHTKNIWQVTVSPDIITKYYPKPSEVRVAPASMGTNFFTTIFLYDDKTLYVSSKNNGYAVLITSEEHHATMRSWFNAIWEQSEKHP
jgi:sugar-specific transcriptional regulator TrmB